MKRNKSIVLRMSTTYPVAGLITLFAGAAAYAAPPSTPNGLRADVYSSTAAEIFWNRSIDSDGFVRGYEVRQDGEVITTFDGLSFFIDSLTEGVSTEFTVTAIDFDNERSEAADITITGGGIVSSSNNTVGRPAPPANLNTVVYSSTAAEVFWDRSTDQPLIYEVSLDGVVVTTTSGTSYFNGSLNDGRSVAVDVVAIGSNGQRSGAANVVFTTTGDTINPSQSANQPLNQPLNQKNGSIISPANVRFEVYSGTAGELFWDRSTQTGVIESTLIRRDGIDLVTTQGASFFDDTRSPGVAYRYEVIFLAFDDTRSEPRVFDENTSSQSPVPISDDSGNELNDTTVSEIPLVSGDLVMDRQINAGNAQTILRQVVSIVNEDPLESFLQSWQSPFGGQGHYIDFFSTEDSPLMVTDRGELSEPVNLNYLNFQSEPRTTPADQFINYSCRAGGSARRIEQADVVGSLTLDNCATVSGTHSGDVLRLVSFHRPFLAAGRYENLTLVDEQGTVSTLSGRFSDGGSLSFVSQRYAPQWIDVDFTSTQNNEPFSLIGFNLRRDESQGGFNPSDNVFRASLSADFSVSADWSQQLVFLVSVDLSVDSNTVFNESTAWESGTISIVAPDGSSMIVELEPSQLFTITLENDEFIGPLEWQDGSEFGFSRHW